MIHNQNNFGLSKLESLSNIKNSSVTENRKMSRGKKYINDVIDKNIAP